MNHKPTPIDFRQVMTDLANHLNDGDCGAVRFGLVVWCDCIDTPMFAGSNDSDIETIVSMMLMAADNMARNAPKFLTIDGEVAGSA